LILLITGFFQTQFRIHPDARRIGKPTDIAQLALGSDANVLFLVVETLLLPVGFLLGGVFASEGDPGLPVLLAPIGAFLVLFAVVLIALGSQRP
jgi:hypothetical protein